MILYNNIKSETTTKGDRKVSENVKIVFIIVYKNTIILDFN